MIFKYPDKFMVLVKRISLDSILECRDFNKDSKNRIIISQEEINDFKRSEQMWIDIDDYYCECEAGYI